MICGLTLDDVKKTPYATHLPILGAVLEYTGMLNSCIEFGMGLYSTPFLLENSKYLRSVETASYAWFIKIRSLITAGKWDPVFQIGPRTELEFIPDMIQRRYDMVLVDGSAACRHVTAQCAQFAAPIVVCHDSNELTDYYQDIVLRDDWHWIDIKDFKPWTAVASMKKDLIDFLQKKFISTRIYMESQLRAKELS